MSRYHKIVMNGEKYYRAFNEATGYYETEILAEQDLMNQLIEEAVIRVVEFDKGEIERAVSTIMDQYQREMVQNYLDYLERLVESLE
jgi:TRAP-type C4-dicarboxylate transport system substrate-binding protein